AAGAAQRDSAFHLTAALFALPAVVFVPFNGALGNALPKRAVLVGSAAFCLAVVAVFAVLGRWWVLGFGLVAVGSAVYFPTRYAVLPAASHETHLPLARINGVIEMGVMLAV